MFESNCNDSVIIADNLVMLSGHSGVLNALASHGFAVTVGSVNVAGTLLLQQLPLHQVSFLHFSIAFTLNYHPCFV